MHGEQAVQKAFAEKLTTKGFQRIECPAQHQEYELPLVAVRKRKRIPLHPSLATAPVQEVENKMPAPQLVQ